MSYSIYLSTHRDPRTLLRTTRQPRSVLATVVGSWTAVLGPLTSGASGSKRRRPWVANPIGLTSGGLWVRSYFRCNVRGGS
eukprot:5943441-Pyramimonas_sp.AAC.1